MNADSIADLVTRLAGQRPVACRDIVNQGFCNRVINIDLDNGRGVILRTTDRSDGLDGYRREAWCLTQALQAGLPGARVLETGICGQTSYMLMDRIEGVAGNFYQGDRTALWHEIGRQSAILNSIGEPADDSTDTVFAYPWRHMIEDRTAWLFKDDLLVRAGILSAAGDATSLIEDLASWHFKPGLAHGNLSPSNVIIGEGDVVHIIDYGEAVAGPVPHCELMDLLAWPVNEAYVAPFCEGYGIRDDDLDAMRPDIDRVIWLRKLTCARTTLENNDSSKDWFTYSARKISNRLLRQPHAHFIPALTGPFYQQRLEA